ncbi:hypothetical protein DSC_14790 [Pseudoxanthomonas spadix BD-a59]|uniref:Uncharacterized protein n=1 Tax=Pseudoxanthomonas spadix (strain BD-a59) TaxID=1045855 RepID=G7UVE1_PSEUP|nr:hypothetical protein DSC_14790 [Pseudoxanthomonas spadix BD-a59]
MLATNTPADPSITQDPGVEPHQPATSPALARAQGQPQRQQQHPGHQHQHEDPNTISSGMAWSSPREQGPASDHGGTCAR